MSLLTDPKAMAQTGKYWISNIFTISLHDLAPVLYW